MNIRVSYRQALSLLVLNPVHWPMNGASLKAWNLIIVPAVVTSLCRSLHVSSDHYQWRQLVCAIVASCQNQMASIQL